MFHRVLSGSSKEEAGTLGVGGRVTGRPRPVQQDVSPAGQRAGQTGGDGGWGSPGAQALGCETGCRVEDIWFSTGMKEGRGADWGAASGTP